MPVYVLFSTGDKVKIAEAEAEFTIQNAEVLGLVVVKSGPNLEKIFWFNMEHVVAIGAHI